MLQHHISKNQHHPISLLPFISCLHFSSPVPFSRLSLVPFLFPLQHRISLSYTANVSCCAKEVGKTQKKQQKKQQ
jgi:hypothetical protein